MLACCYLITAVCLVHGERILRRYYGIYKIRANQCRESARRRREQSHLEKPVKWLGAADLSTFEMVAVGHPMAVQQALLQEAILTAEAFGDKGPPCRGGPWSNPKIGQKGRDEITDVRRLARNAACPSDARQQVLEYCRKNGYLMLASTDVLSRGGSPLPAAFPLWEAFMSDAPFSVRHIRRRALLPLLPLLVLGARVRVWRSCPCTALAARV
jgi:hypothetical protein